MPTPKTYKGGMDAGSAGYKTCAGGIPVGAAHSPCSDIKERSTRGSVSNENNILLDPEILTDYPTQALLLTVLVRCFLLKRLMLLLGELNSNSATGISFEVYTGLSSDVVFSGMLVHRLILSGTPQEFAMYL